MNHELRIHKHITEQDGGRREDPPMQTNHKHGGDVESVTAKLEID